MASATSVVMAAAATPVEAMAAAVVAGAGVSWAFLGFVVSFDRLAKL